MTRRTSTRRSSRRLRANTRLSPAEMALLHEIAGARQGLHLQDGRRRETAMNLHKLGLVSVQTTSEKVMRRKGRSTVYWSVWLTLTSAGRSLASR
jgi:hypothetical protein